MDKQIKKYLRGKLSDAERKELERIFRLYGYTLDAPEHPVPAADMPDAATAARIKQQIMQQIAPTRAKQIRWRWAAVAAAMLVGIIGVVTQLYAPRERSAGTSITWHTQSNPGKGVMRMTMPDSSRIWLNAASSIRYPDTYNDTNRTVYLQGEAYFEVSEDRSRPFHVYADSMHITVLGTSFNVAGYRDEPFHSVTVVSGRVRTAISGSQETVRELQPGDRFEFDRHRGAIHVGNVTADDAIAWREGLLVFNDRNLGAVTRVLARRYGATFRFVSPKEQKQKVTLKIPNESLRTVMQTLQSATGIPYEINGLEVTIGTTH